MTSFSSSRFPPTVRNVACVEIKTVNDVFVTPTLFVVDLDGNTPGARILITFQARNDRRFTAWSPDGSRLALNALDSKTKEGSIALVDLDGSKYRKPASAPRPLESSRFRDWKTITPGLRVGAPDNTSDPENTARGRYEALLQEISKAAKIHDDASAKGQDCPKSDRGSTRRSFPMPNSTPDAFLAIAESCCPSDLAGVDAARSGW